MHVLNFDLFISTKGKGLGYITQCRCPAQANPICIGSLRLQILITNTGFRWLCSNVVIPQTEVYNSLWIKYRCYNTHLSRGPWLYTTPSLIFTNSSQNWGGLTNCISVWLDHLLILSSGNQRSKSLKLAISPNNFKKCCDRRNQEYMTWTVVTK